MLGALLLCPSYCAFLPGSSRCSPYLLCLAAPCGFL